VAVGGSAGSLDALTALLDGLPRGWRTPIVVVIHLPPDGPSTLPAVLAEATDLAVHEAEDKQPIGEGGLYVARPGYHLLVDDGPMLALSVDEPVHFCRPSIDVLLESAAATCGADLAAVILSGANEDGAHGLAAVRAAGGVVAVQAPEDALAGTMPQAALRACPDAVALPARALGPFLASLGERRLG
jgi:two-component system chemotaxis response regulator CheB